MSYLTIKYVHMLCAYGTIIFFLCRAYWSIQQSPLRQQRWVRVLPHCIDSLLLVCAVYMTYVIGFQDFVIAKILALLLYIGLGTMALKRAKTHPQKIAATVAATVVFLYILGCALKKSPWSWLVYA